MITQSAAYESGVRALGGLAVRIAKVEIVDPTGKLKRVLDVASGSVTWSRQSGAIVAQCNIEAVDRDGDLGVDEDTTIRQNYYGAENDTYGGMGGIYGTYSTTIQTGALMPYGPEARVYSGYRVGGQNLYVLLGTFQLRDMVSDGNRRISLTTVDRSTFVQDQVYGFEPVSIPLGTNYKTAMETVFRSGFNNYWRPRITSTIASTPLVTGKLDFGTSPGGNRWADIASMARLCGMYARFNRSGNLEIAAAADPLTSPAAWTIETGPRGALVTANRSLSKSNSFNGTLVTGTNSGSSSDDPIRGQAYDQLTGSPTFWQGPYGYKPRVISSSLVTSSAMAQNLANEIQTEQQGVAEELTVNFLPHDGLELTDIVHVTHPRLGVDYNYRQERLTIPLLRGLSQSVLRRYKSVDDY